jgi:hypothetical protein
VVASGWREPERVPADALDADTASDWRPTLTLYACTDEEWEQQWPHKFEAAYTVTLMEPDPPEEPDAAFMARAAADFSPGAQQQEREEAVAARARAQRAAPGPPPEEEEGGEQQRARPSVLRCELQASACVFAGVEAVEMEGFGCAGRFINAPGPLLLAAGHPTPQATGR